MALGRETAGHNKDWGENPSRSWVGSFLDQGGHGRKAQPNRAGKLQACSREGLGRCCRQEAQARRPTEKRLSAAWAGLGCGQAQPGLAGKLIPGRAWCGSAIGLQAQKKPRPRPGCGLAQGGAVHPQKIPFPFFFLFFFFFFSNPLGFRKTLICF